jgi:hypothetical protein
MGKPMVEQILDRSFASAWQLFRRAFGRPKQRGPAAKPRAVAWFVLRQWISDPRLLSAGFLVSAAMFFGASHRVKYPAVELPLNFFLGIIGILTIIIPLTKIRGFWGYLRRLINARKARAGAHARVQTGKPKLVQDLPFETRPGRFPAISIGRAWQHIFHSWKGERVFKAELGRYDHTLLYLATLGTIVALFLMLLLRHHYGPWLFFPEESPLQYLFDGWFFIGVFATFGPGHYRALRASESVGYNAATYRKQAEAVIDDDIWNIVKKFEAATGWRTLWSNNPDYLVGTDRSTHTIILSVGWVLRSDRASDKRRAGYLAEVLRLIRHAIETAPSVKSA